MLNQEAVEEFKKLYLQEYGVQLTDQQAVEHGIRLIRFIKTVYGNDLPKVALDKESRK